MRSHGFSALSIVGLLGSIALASTPINAQANVERPVELTDEIVTCADMAPVLWRQRLETGHLLHFRPMVAMETKR